ncbi:MAG: DEAD/DEAH box helicase [Candidatus Pacebacteria bacterium]|nr:DEAD/DEAH box helicase [Candidatus Paceibacterota bacterium]
MNTFRTHSKFGSKRRRFNGRDFARATNKFSSKKIDISRFIAESATNTVKHEEYISKYRFADFKIDQKLKNNIIKKGYDVPTPIQDQAIPLILEERDLIGIANTGTGKTAAFLIPKINHTLLNKNSKTIILTPTRELALQIEKEFRDFSKGLNMYSVSCIGGTSIRKQFMDLRRNYNFVIGTPGRVKDLIQRKSLNLSLFNTVILDEADRMLDMGFINDIRFILEKMPEKKQALCFSATLSSEIEGLCNKFLDSPVKVSVKVRESSENVDQKTIKSDDKVGTLCDLLAKDNFKKVLIFGRTKHGVEKLSKILKMKGFIAESIHGDKTQAKRQRALDAFKGNKIRVLVATDVAARGLDIDDITHVINYDMPGTYEDYIHRIGRTGRCQKKGTAITFI